MPVILSSGTPFPDPHLADEDGLVALGGDLSVERLLAAYSSGIFPWYDEESPILWWSPGHRAIFDLQTFRPPSRLARTIRQRGFTFRINSSFREVIQACSQRDEGTWITPELIRAYEHLHLRGYAHCLETWQNDSLVGGIYGVALGGLFAGESMFSRVSDASKAALCQLIEHLRMRGYQLFDIQVINNHTASLGAIEIPRAEYLKRLRLALQQPITFCV
ncbi:MAG: leucyl/phenylalanyl-tRNA--protein transferase [Gemmataceae bacterium]